VCGDEVVVDELPHRVVIDGLDRGHFVRGAEAVEEVNERHPAAQRCGMGHQCHVVGLLHRVGAQHRGARLPRRHHITVIAEDAQRMGGDRAGRHVDHRRCQLAGDLVHVRDHEQQSLRGRECRPEGPGLQRSMERTGCAGLALHLDDVRHTPPEVGLVRLCPGVGELTHRRGRSDWIDRHDLGQGERNFRRRLVAVDDDAWCGVDAHSPGMVAQHRHGC
jgi:hypothetical protein